MKRAGANLVPLAVALLGAFLYHRYSILTGLDRVEADPGDSRFIAFLLEHWNNVAHGAADWRSPPIFWPVAGTLAYSDALVAMGGLHAALRGALGVFEAINLQLILLSLASFAAAYALLARGLAWAPGERRSAHISSLIPGLASRNSSMCSSSSRRYCRCSGCLRWSASGMARG